MRRQGSNSLHRNLWDHTVPNYPTKGHLDYNQNTLISELAAEALRVEQWFYGFSNLAFAPLVRISLMELSILLIQELYNVD